MKANGFDGLSALYAGSPLPPGDTTGYDPPVDLGPMDPNKDPLDVLKTWSTYVEQTGHSLSIGDYTTDKSLLTLFSNIERGTRATLLLGNEASTVGHNVVVQSATLKVISKINGSMILKTSFKVMNPSSGGYIEPLIIDRINGLLYIK